MSERKPKSIVVAAACLNQTPLDWDNNLENILQAITEARRQGVEVLCLPELCITGYGCEDAFLAEFVSDKAQLMLERIAARTKGMLVSVGLPLRYKKSIYNAAALICNGRVLGYVCKQNLAGDGVYYEPRWFKPWPVGEVGRIVTAHGSYPIGDVFFNVSGLRIGFEICEDAWVARRPGADLSARAVDLILNPSASHFAFGKSETRRRFVLEGSRAFGVVYLYSNLIGNDAGRIIFDGDCFVASCGTMLTEGPRLTFAPVTVTPARVDLTLGSLAQSRNSSFKPQTKDDPAREVHAEFKFTGKAARKLSVSRAAAWEASRDAKYQEFTRAVALGLFDYLRKSRSCGFVVSLSGGADSSAVSCLVAAMVALGVQELGLKNFLARFPYIDGLRRAATQKQIVRCLLTCVYQATAQSGKVTKQAARALSSALGAEFYELQIEDLVRSYVGLVEDSIDRKLSWAKDDLALQNVQARVRGPAVWLLANVRRALLLTTSNRSEAAVGYATMDGDTCGGLAPIGGIDKAFLREWLRWMEKKGLKELGPVAALKFVNQQAPTAELRPAKYNQTDEADLMPYPVLDAIERLAIRDKKSPKEVYAAMLEQRGKYSALQIKNWTARFFKLWGINQWKRERYAPSFHLDDENLDPKTWCRFPILSGNFVQEIAELQNDNARAK